MSIKNIQPKTPPQGPKQSPPTRRDSPQPLRKDSPSPSPSREHGKGIPRVPVNPVKK